MEVSSQTICFSPQPPNQQTPFCRCSPRNGRKEKLNPIIQINRTNHATQKFEYEVYGWVDKHYRFTPAEIYSIISDNAGRERIQIAPINSSTLDINIWIVRDPDKGGDILLEARNIPLKGLTRWTISIIHALQRHQKGKASIVERANWLSKAISMRIILIQVTAWLVKLFHQIWDLFSTSRNSFLLGCNLK